MWVAISCCCDIFGSKIAVAVLLVMKLIFYVPSMFHFMLGFNETLNEDRGNQRTGRHVAYDGDPSFKLDNGPVLAAHLQCHDFVLLQQILMV